MGSAFMHGWVSLPTWGEMYLEYEVTRRLRKDGKVMADVELLVEEDSASHRGIHS